MPYVGQEARKHLSVGGQTRNAGELNYVVTRACLRHLRSLEGPGRTLGYQDYNDVIGALECAKQEIYRRMVVPHEEKKMHENGDVF